MTATTTKGLRFAPIIRVSTEGQERRGESLTTQRAQIEKDVESLGGTIPESCWAYAGQEHATVGEEREKLNRLLTDAAKDRFDAVIVCDPSRWSRDNRKSKEGLEILKANGIRFFVRTSEKNLYSPMDALFLGMSTEINEFVALEQARKSLENRIERARRGIPVARPLPCCRTFDPKTGLWGLDKEEAEKMRWAVAQYLAGEGADGIAGTLGIHPTTLFKRLKNQLGWEWSNEFNSDRLNIHISVPMAVPPLVDEDTQLAVQEKIIANRTYSHGGKKHKYLLSRMVFCGDCGSALSGSAPKESRRYWHLPGFRLRGESAGCPLCGRSVDAEQLEQAVTAHLFDLFGDPALVERAVERATPNVVRLGELRTQREQLAKQLKNLEARKSRLREAIMSGTVSATDEGVKKDNSELSEQGAHVIKAIEKIDLQLHNVPKPQEVKKRTDSLLRWLGKFAGSPSQWRRMEHADKRALVERAFGGRDAEGRRLGVYLTNPGDSWTFEIRGILPEVRTGSLAMADERVAHLLAEDADASLALTREEAVQEEARSQDQFEEMQTQKTVRGGSVPGR